jgi:hypothetical protein
VLPADECLDPRDPSRRQLDDGLVEDVELAASEAARQLGAQLVPRDDGGVDRRLEHRYAVLAGRLRGVHRDVGVAQQLVGADARARRRDADADADVDLPPVERERPAQRLDDAVGHAGRPGKARVVVEQDGELVAAEPGRDVAGSHGRPQPPGDAAQQPVAGVVAEGVVDDLEVVEIEEHHDRHLRTRPLDPVTHGFEEQGPVRQAGERVVIGLVAELLLEPRQLGK